MRRFRRSSSSWDVDWVLSVVKVLLVSERQAGEVVQGIAPGRLGPVNSKGGIRIDAFGIDQQDHETYQMGPSGPWSSWVWPGDGAI